MQIYLTGLYGMRSNGWNTVRNVHVYITYTCKYGFFWAT